MDSVDVGQLVGVAVLIHSLFPAEVKANFIHSVHYAGAQVEVCLFLPITVLTFSDYCQVMGLLALTWTILAEDPATL
jgi:hypothetical protein